MPPLPPPLSLPEHRLAKNGLGVRGKVTGRPNHPGPTSQLESCSSPAQVPSRATKCDLNWWYAGVGISWSLTGLV